MVEEFELLERQQLVIVPAWWVEVWWLNYVALRRESHIWDNILTFGEEAHGNAGTALRRNYCRLAGLGTFERDKQNRGLFSVAP